MFLSEKLLYRIPRDSHGPKEVAELLRAHPEVRFVSLVAVDIFGHDTDEKIPVSVFLEDPEKFLCSGVQTDGSSVFLPGIADLSNAKVDLLPDSGVAWYVDYNFNNLDTFGIPVGTLRIPAFLIHNSESRVGSRVILQDSINYFCATVKDLLNSNAHVFSDLTECGSKVEEIFLTAATELEFYVKTPKEAADRERLHASQEMKEQYWKRTIGPVRTALEESIELLNSYGFEVEMGHKEAGGIKAEMVEGGSYDHIMEQLEIDWKYSDPMQTADNERFARYVIRDIFRRHGLEVSFMAKPVPGVAGSGKHTHIGVCAKMANGRKCNLFTARDGSYLSSIGFGALMGLLKNYEIIAPFASANTDAFNRLKPGFEAPVCVVTSLGHSPLTATRNRTVLIGLVRDSANPMATHFELRSPNPKSNIYLVLASSLMAMCDGMRAAVCSGKSAAELFDSVSKEYGAEDFYLEKNRIYRAENDIFSDYSGQEREKLFGRAPATVWECISAFDKYPEKTALLYEGGVMSVTHLNSYKASVTDLWSAELRERFVPESKNLIRSCRRIEGEDMTGLDESRWQEISNIRRALMQDTETEHSMLSCLIDALKDKNYSLASDLQLKIQQELEELDAKYREYEHNLI